MSEKQRKQFWQLDFISVCVFHPISVILSYIYKEDSVLYLHGRLWSYKFCIFSCIQVGAILGRSGCVVKEIMSLSGTQIQVQSTRLLCSGSIFILFHHLLYSHGCPSLSVLSIIFPHNNFLLISLPGYLLTLSPLHFSLLLFSSNIQISQKDAVGQGQNDKLRQVKVIGLQHQVS